MSATAGELFECVWPFCGVGAESVEMKLKISFGHKPFSGKMKNGFYGLKTFSKWSVLLEINNKQKEQWSQVSVIHFQLHLQRHQNLDQDQCY